MAVIRKKDYVVVPNEYFNDNLSLEALGLLMIIMNNGNSVFTLESLADEINDDKETIQTAFDELREKGYIDG